MSQFIVIGGTRDDDKRVWRIKAGDDRRVERIVAKRMRCDDDDANGDRYNCTSLASSTYMT